MVKQTNWGGNERRSRNIELKVNLRIAVQGPLHFLLDDLKCFNISFWAVFSSAIWKLDLVSSHVEQYFFSDYIHCMKSVHIRRFFWSVFSCIRTQYRDLLCKSPYSVRIQENAGQKKSCIWALFTQWYYHTLWIFAVNCLRHFCISVLGFWLYIIKMILSRPVYASACLYGSMSILITTEKENPQCSLKCSIEWIYFLNLNQITGVKCDTCHFMLKKKVVKATWQCYLYYHGDIICQVTSKTAFQHVLFFNFYIPKL